ncbi:putative acetyltransferase [Caenibius tardaugens NBRC 16725]|uniref:Putative acetyltransferase n=1 Tax=Caenibius tardaugens NBRC 16725 TaxID=1219035 RepID=U2Y4P0_9SPHN|nr:GNAT family N-acetyltransferase [Caenibius tardaugens]AZI34560.1 GNAT family N-acetyltransferase [Caenibius tardaugens NBRC 16725]GAD48061.1 putative acetyltransferase [Caenibius tardaugens NBRC 16725]
MNQRDTDGWRPMTTADLPAVQMISDAVHGAYTEPKGILAERLTLYPEGCQTLERGGVVVGYIITHPWHRDTPPKLGQPLGAIPEESDTYYLHDIALLPAGRGGGSGRAATDFTVMQARAGGFADITLIAVNGADSFWASQGFAYVEGGDAVTYGEGTYLMRRIVSD